MTLIPIPVWLLIVLGVLMLPVRARAETLIAKDNAGTIVTLTEEPCANTDPWMRLRKATMFYQGKTYSACWRLVGQVVVVFDDAGDVTPVMVQQFRKPEEV